MRERQAGGREASEGGGGGTDLRRERGVAALLVEVSLPAARGFSADAAASPDRTDPSPALLAGGGGGVAGGGWDGAQPRCEEINGAAPPLMSTSPTPPSCTPPPPARRRTRPRHQMRRGSSAPRPALTKYLGLHVAVSGRTRGYMAGGS